MDRLACHAVAFPQEISFEEIQEALPFGDFHRVEGACFHAGLGARKHLYLFRYRALVFVGFSSEEKDSIVHSIVHERSNPSFEADEFELLLGVEKSAVDFHSLSLPDFDLEIVSVLAQVLARSCALSIVEREVEEIVKSSEQMAGRVNRKYSWWPKPHRMLSHLQEVLRVRHRLIVQLSLLRDPDVIWDSEEYDRVYRRLVENFDFRDRIDSVERQLELSAEVARLQLETIHSRRSEFLEIIIILLILIEVLHTFSEFL